MLADRQQIVASRKAGQSYRPIAAATGWSYEVVRKVWYNHKRSEETGLPAAKVGRPATGLLSTLDFVWLLDFDEKLNWPSVGWTNVMNVPDLATGITMGSYVHPAGSPPK